MISLDDTGEIKNLDSGNVIGSLVSLASQLKEAWYGARLVRMPGDYREVRNIVVPGMGGSGLGAHLIRSVFDLPLPLQIVNDYVLPSFVGKDTLVIVSSYSGGTEETIATFRGALEKGAKVVGITSGGNLATFLREKNLPVYQFDPKYNPCGQPRMGLGYSVGGILGLLNQLGLVKLLDPELEKAIGYIKTSDSSFGLGESISNNPAKAMATKLIGKTPIIIAAEFLAGNAHIFANQINENAKTFAAYFLLPEIDHHLLEGISLPDGLGEKIKFFFLETALYSEKIKQRVKITKEVLAKADIESISYNTKGTSKVEASFETLAFSSWASFYLAILNEIDPTPVPNVDFFKEQLAKFA